MQPTPRTCVGLARGANRRQTVYHSLELVADDIVAKLRTQLLIKPNFLSSTNQLASSHVDAVRGILDFLAIVPNPPKEIIIAEGANETYSGQSFDNLHYRALVQESPIPIRLVDLHQETD